VSNSFHAAGVIATDLVRRETRNGVVTTFRLAAGRPDHGQLWIDIETWGHQAGRLNTHGHPNRGITITGRLTQKIWHNPGNHQRRTRLVVTATDFDFWPTNPDLNPADGTPIGNHLIVAGRVQNEPTHHHTNGHHRSTFTLSAGQAKTKTGRLWLPIKTFGNATTTAHHITKGDHIICSRQLAYTTKNVQTPTPPTGHHYLDTTTLHLLTDADRKPNR
jgi:single-stranded DNA-binding protein